MEIKEVGETPRATSVTNLYIKKNAKADLQIANAMNLMNRFGCKGGPNKTNFGLM